MIFKIYTDGSCANNLKASHMGGWAFLITNASTGDIKAGAYGPSAKDTTSNRMELTAVWNALKKIPKDNEVHVVTDSMYIVDIFKKHYANWMRYGWKTREGDSVKNEQLIKEIAAQIFRIGDVFFFHQTRNTCPESVWCDKYSKIGRRLRNTFYYGAVNPEYIFPSKAEQYIMNDIKVGDLLIAKLYELKGKRILQVDELARNNTVAICSIAYTDKPKTSDNVKHYLLKELAEHYMPFADYTETFVQKELVNA